MKTTIELAREAGIDAWWDSGSDWRETFNEHLKAFEALVRADERALAAPVQEKWGLSAVMNPDYVAAQKEKAQQALDVMAENARELGLDYEPVWNNLPSNKDVEDAMRMKRLNQLAIAAAVPDAFGTREGEHPQYIQGWNDCRAETLKMRKP